MIRTWVLALVGRTSLEQLRILFAVKFLLRDQFWTVQEQLRTGK